MWHFLVPLFAIASPISAYRKDVFGSFTSSKCVKFEGGFTQKIFQGQAAQPGEFAFVVSLRRIPFDTHFCGGSILTEKWVLTAGHCLTTTPNKTYVIAGTIANTGLEEPKLEVLNFVVHPDYKIVHEKFIADIALVEMKEEFVFSDFIQPVPLGRFNRKSIVLTVGWGLVNRQNVSGTLQFVQMEVVDHSGLCKTDEVRFCAAHVGRLMKATTCSGDSGGPVIDSSNGRLVGITSYGWVDCDFSDNLIPDQYTRVDAHLEWISNYLFCSL